MWRVSGESSYTWSTSSDRATFWALWHLQEAIYYLCANVVLVCSEQVGLDEPIGTARDVVLGLHIFPCKRLSVSDRQVKDAVRVAPLKLVVKAR